MRRLGWLWAIGLALGCSNIEPPPHHGPHAHDEHIYPATPVETPLPLKNAEYSGARYRQARFYTPGRSRAVDMIVIHTTGGRYNGTISWFQDPNNTKKTSAHYVIQSSDGEITQMVKERDTAHHVRGYNSRSIGIEHEAFIAESRWYTDAMYRSSAALVRYLCNKYNIPMDRTHIRGHLELDPSRRKDPGHHWDWSKFMNLVRNGQSGGGATPPAPQPDPVQGDCRFRYWNCTADRRARIRCENGREAERQACAGGCQVMQVGTDDVCRPAAQDGQNHGACNAGGLPGTCMHISQCAGQPTPGLCPGDRTIQCCTDVQSMPQPPADPNPPAQNPPPQSGGGCTVGPHRGNCVDISNQAACQGTLDWAEACGDFGACCFNATPTPPPSGGNTPPPPEPRPSGCTINGVRGQCVDDLTADDRCPAWQGAELWETPECGAGTVCCVGSAANDNGQPPPGDPAPPPPAQDDVFSRAEECDVHGEWGLCVPTAACRADGGQSTPGHCPGAADIQCCTWR